MKASEVMTRRVLSTSPNATFAATIKLMLKNGISGLPVMRAGSSWVQSLPQR